MRTTSRALRLAILAAVAALALAACASGSGAGSSGGLAQVSGGTNGAGYRGDVLNTPVTLSASVQYLPFQTDAGATADLASLQAGKLLLLYFGYTHCPDVCPTTMADLGAALKDSPLSVQQATQVVFVTSDPARDTPAVMSDWLAHFDTGLPVPFVGLTAPIAQIDSVAKSVGIPLEPPVTNSDGSITVEHGAQVLAFQDNKASVLWLAGTPSSDYQQDIAKLLAKGSK